MQRLLTGLLMAPLALLAVFYLPSVWFFLVLAVAATLAATELVRIAKVWSPKGPLTAIVGLVPLTMAVLADILPLLRPRLGQLGPSIELLGAATALVLASSALVLLRRTPVAESLPALGALTFGVLYLAVPGASIFLLREIDPWLVVLLFIIVWLGDTAAYYVGKRFGRHKLAPAVSPKKTWEGAAAGFGAALIGVAAWSLVHLETVDWRILLLGGVTSVIGQMGDLVESMVKRGAGIKDSGDLLPGHGGVLDRLDALLFAAPVLLFGLLLLGIDLGSG